MSVSLQKNIKDCKVDTSWAARLRSDRFENPNNMACPVWSGRDLTGRAVCADSFYTKSAGCNTPMDRVSVENTLRPQYMEQVTTDAYGFRSDLYSPNSTPSKTCTATARTTPAVLKRPACPVCPLYPYDWDQAQPALIADYSRHAQSLEHKMRSREFLLLSGFY